MTLAGSVGRGFDQAHRVGTRPLAPYNVEISDTFAHAFDLWSGLALAGAALPFQSTDWLRAWNATFGQEAGVDVLAATVYDACWTPVMGLPLVRRRVGARRIISFADGGVADYNAPILSPFAPSDRSGARLLWKALLRALPRADVVRLEKMPAMVGNQTNPLTLLAGARPATAAGLALTMPETYAEWRAALPRRYRMELGRCGRLFDALPGAAFRRIDASDDTILVALERLQRDRIQSLGLPYQLDGETFHDFYRRLADGSADGAAVLTALTTHDDIVAVMLGLRQGNRFVMLRIGAANGAYARLSPGRHLITRTMETLRAEGVECFDFGLGDYSYKRKLGGEPIPLSDLVSARSPLGLPDAARFRLRSQVRANPHLRRLAARLRMNGPEAVDRGI